MKIKECYSKAMVRYTDKIALGGISKSDSMGIIDKPVLDSGLISDSMRSI